MNVKIDGLANAVISQLDYYKAMVNENVGEVFEDVADQALTTIKEKSQSAGFNDKRYSKGWSKIVRRNSVTGVYGIVIHNKKYYRLTHLLEKGHAFRSGGRARAFPHIAPTQAEMDRVIVEKIKEVIEE